MLGLAKIIFTCEGSVENVESKDEIDSHEPEGSNFKKILLIELRRSLVSNFYVN